MRTTILNIATGSFLVAVFSFLVTSSPTTLEAKASGAFASLHGSWSGGGTVRLDTGHTEKIRCRAYYKAKSGGSKIGMSIRCASKDNKFELRAHLNDSDGSVSGSWEERTFNAAGQVSGRASARSLKLRISGALQGRVSISTKGRKQWVSISTGGPGLKSLTISLRRRG